MKIARQLNAGFSSYKLFILVIVWMLVLGSTTANAQVTTLVYRTITTANIVGFGVEKRVIWRGYHVWQVDAFTSTIPMFGSIEYGTFNRQKLFWRGTLRMR